MSSIETPSRRTAVITGGSSGIGRAIVERFVDDGFAVVIADIAPPVDVSPDSPIRFIEVDITDEGSVEAFYRAVSADGGIDVLVNVAGIAFKRTIGEFDLAALQRISDVNVAGTLLMIKHALRLMDAGRRPSIVNIASLGAFSTMTWGNFTYAASKGAVVSLTKALVFELAPRGIRINAIAPGAVNTAMSNILTEEARRRVTSRVPMSRFAEAKEIASVASFLASDDASYMTGQILVVDGGISAVIYSDEEALGGQPSAETPA